MSQSPQINEEIPVSHAVPQLENTIEGEAVVMPQDTVESFMTSKGSVYTYDSEGHTTRLKAATGELQPEQGITVFVEAGVKDVPRVAAAYLLRSSTNNTRIEVVETQEDETIKIINDVTEVSSPDRLLVATLSDGKVVKSRPASLFPVIGTYPFDSRTFEEDGEVKTERHIGHRVTSIQHKTTDAK
ncbi:MAG: hypothetical protein NTX11_01435 [Candidatus Saccharibacteria bacterium]|nr:hypothetical protein [Candidatus Saccharibacteria bacterium]